MSVSSTSRDVLNIVTLLSGWTQGITDHFHHGIDRHGQVIPTPPVRIHTWTLFTGAKKCDAVLMRALLTDLTGKLSAHDVS